MFSLLWKWSDMFQHPKWRFQILLTHLVIVDLVQLVQDPFHWLHDFQAQQVVDTLQSTDPDAFVEYVESLEVEHFLLLVQVIKSKRGLNEDCPFGVGEVDDFIKQVPQERVAILIFKLGHGYVVIIVELFISDFLKNVKVLFHISITVNQLLKLLVEHLQSMNVDEVLDVLQTHLETGKVSAQLDQFLLEGLWWLRLYGDFLLQNLSDQSYQLLSNTRLEQLPWVYLDHSQQVTLHVQNTLRQYRNLVGMFGDL